MDELEISGKRYLSSKRAAKEHKYHADYIGQLIRAGKVLGTKVGRAWYVEAESLAEYLASESTQTAPVYTPAVAPVAQIKKEEPRAALPHSYSVPIKKVAWDEPAPAQPTLKTNTLRYIADDEPLFPTIQKTTYTAPLEPQHTHVPQARKVVYAPHTKSVRPVAVLLLVLIVGGITFGSVFFASTKLLATVVVEQGKPAIVGFSFK